MVISAVTSHAAISRAGEPTLRALSAGILKMPDPIIEPATRAVALKSPSPWTKCADFPGASLCVGTCITLLPENSEQSQLFLRIPPHRDRRRLLFLCCL